MGKGSTRKTLTDTPLFQPSQSICALSVIPPSRILAKDIEIAVSDDRPTWTPQGDGDDDEANEPQYKDHEGHDHDNAWQQPALADEPDDEQHV